MAIISAMVGFVTLKRKQKKTVATDKWVKISVIIPFRNEANNLLMCLESIQKQSFSPHLFEVILVDDHSTDDAAEIAKKFISRTNINIRLTALSKNKTSKKEALKHGIQQAVYPIIATTDADCVLPKDWLKTIGTHFQSNNGMLLGAVAFTKTKGFLAAFQTLDMFAIQGLEFGLLGFNKPVINNAANLSYGLDAYTKVGGFDTFNTPSGDDVFLLEKFKFQKLPIAGILSDKFIVETKPETHWADFFNQRVRWSSKSKHYKDKTLLFFSGLILLQNFAVAFGYFALFFNDNYRWVVLGVLLSKWLVDFILLFLVARFFKRKYAMSYFIPVQLVYPIYVLVIFTASILLKFEWKGRKY